MDQMHQLMFVMPVCRLNQPVLMSTMITNVGWEQQATVALVKEGQIKKRNKDNR
jgi:hypothetical protein